jgi:hypothetical protein
VVKGHRGAVDPDLAAVLSTFEARTTVSVSVDYAQPMDSAGISSSSISSTKSRHA